MSRVRNTVLAGNGLNASDKTTSITTWSSVKANNGNIYVFCQWIQTTEAGNPIYSREKAYRSNVSGVGYDYYPCHLQGSDSVYGVYNKVDNSFTQKTLLTSASHGEDKSYGISTGDVKAVCGSGYHNLILIMCEDGGVQSWVDDEHPADAAYCIAELKYQGSTFVGLRFIDLAFYLAPSVPLPPDRIEVVESVTYTYKYYHLPEYQNTSLEFLLSAPYNLPMWGGPSGLPYIQLNPDNNYVNGDLVKGRKPRWNLWADNVNLGKSLIDGGSKLCNSDGNYNNQKVCSVNIFKYVGRSDDGHIQLRKWQNYDSSKFTAPSVKIDNNNKLKLEKYNGVSVALSVASYLNSLMGYSGTYNMAKTDNRMVWLYNKSMLSELHIKLGNLLDWNATTQNFVTYGLQVLLHGEPYLGHGGAQTPIVSKTFYGVNSSTPMNSSSSAAVKKLFKDGLNTDDTQHNWDIGIDAEIIDTWLTYWENTPVEERNLHKFFLTVLPICQGITEVKVGGMWNVGVDYESINIDSNVFPLYQGFQGISWIRGDYALTPGDYASKTMCGIDTTKFRFVLKTPTITVNGVDYNVIPAMHYQGVYADEWRNQPSSFDDIGGCFFIRNLSNGIGVGNSYGGGVGWRFVLEKVNKTGDPETDYLKNRSSWNKINKLQCTMVITTIDGEGVKRTCTITKEASFTSYLYPNNNDEYANTKFANLFGYSSYGDTLEASSNDYPEDAVYRIAALSSTGQLGETNVIPTTQMVVVKQYYDGSGNDVYMLNPNSTVVLSITPISN